LVFDAVVPIHTTPLVAIDGWCIPKRTSRETILETENQLRFGEGTETEKWLRFGDYISISADPLPRPGVSPNVVQVQLQQIVVSARFVV